MSRAPDDRATRPTGVVVLRLKMPASRDAAPASGLRRARPRVAGWPRLRIPAAAVAEASRAATSEAGAFDASADRRPRPLARDAGPLRAFPSTDERLRRRLRALQACGAAPRDRSGAPAAPAVISADHIVGEKRGLVRALRLVAVALTGALLAHLAFGAWSLTRRPQRAHATTMAMAIAPSEELPPEDPPLAPPPPPKATRRAAAPSLAPAPAAPSFAPSFFADAAGDGGGDGDAAGGFGGIGALAPPAPPDDEQAQPKEPPRPPRALSRAAPQYPASARHKGLEGRVVLQLLVDERGQVRDVRVLDADPPGVFDDAAVAAARRFSFEPATAAGRPTQAWVRQVIRFTLDHA